jgi:transcriptional regulator with XRE-family HTH domain
MTELKDVSTPPGFAGSVGAGLGRRREQAGVTLRALARRVGVSPSLISQIEHGKASPSVGTLYAIVSALDISLDELLFDAPASNPQGRRPNGEAPAGGAPESPAETRTAGNGPVLRRRERPSITLATGVRWERLTPATDSEVDFLYVVYDVNGESCSADALMRHGGREYGLVLQGRLGATVGFESYELEPGDSITFNSTTPHRFWTIGDEPTIVVWTILGRDGDPRA